MHCKYLPVVPYKALENFSKALYGTTGGTYSACIIRPVMQLARKECMTKVCLDVLESDFGERLWLFRHSFIVNR